VSSPEPVQIPSKIRSVVIQDPPKRSVDNANDRRGGSRSQPSQSQSVSVVPEAAVDEDDEEDIWSTPNASPDRNYRRSRSRSRGAADRRLSRSVSCRTSVAQVKSSIEKRGRSKTGQLECVDSAHMATQTPSPPTRSSAGAGDQPRNRQRSKGQGGGHGPSDSLSSDDGDRKRKNSRRNGDEYSGPPGGDREKDKSTEGDKDEGLKSKRSRNRLRSGSTGKREESRRRSRLRHRSRSCSTHRRKNWIRPNDYNGTTCVETSLSRFECAADYKWLEHG